MRIYSRVLDSKFYWSRTFFSLLSLAAVRFLLYCQIELRGIFVQVSVQSRTTDFGIVVINVVILLARKRCQPRINGCPSHAALRLLKANRRRWKTAHKNAEYVPVFTRQLQRSLTRLCVKLP